MKKTAFFLLVLILALAAFLRFYRITDLPPALFPDEAVNGINALQANETGDYKVFYPENNGREGLFINIQALSVKIFGNEAWALRVVSGLFGVLTVLGIYLLAKELLSQRGIEISEKKKYAIALLAAFLLATSFWHINFSRIGFRAITSTFWAVWAFYLIFLAWRKLREAGSFRAYVFWAFLAGLVFGLGFHSYIAYRAMPALAGLVFFWQFFEAKRTGVLRHFFTYAALIILGAIITFLPLALHFIEAPGDFLGRTGEVSIFKSATPLKDLALNIAKTAAMFNLAGDFNQRHNYFGRPELYLPVGIFFLVGVFLAIRSLRKLTLRIGNHEEGVPPFILLFLLAWLAIAALPVVVSNEGIPHALRSIIMIPPVFLLAAIGGIFVYEKFFEGGHKVFGSKALAPASAVILLLVLASEAYISYFLLWGQDPRTKDAFAQNFTDTANELKVIPRERPKAVVYDPGAMGINVIQFLTNTATEKTQNEQNLHYYASNITSEDSLRATGYFTARVH